MLDRARNQLRVTRGAPRRKRAIPRHRGKVTTLNIFHREVVLTLMFARFVDRDNVRVPQVGRRLRFRTKAKHFLSACELTRENQFERNHAVQAALTRLKRSEERRVGKECRSRCTPQHKKNKYGEEATL